MGTEVLKRASTPGRRGVTDASEHGHYVLVVDDDDDLRETLALLLARSGREVLTAANGAEALQVLQANPARPCLVLLDLMMPVLDGFQVLARMTADPRLATVPVVILTGAGPLAERRAGGIKVEILRKPHDLDPAKILAKVESLCAGGRLGPA
jgi:CheY-like chemotaxis protein